MFLHREKVRITGGANTKQLLLKGPVKQSLWHSNFQTKKHFGSGNLDIHT